MWSKVWVVDMLDSFWKSKEGTSVTNYNTWTLELIVLRMLILNHFDGKRNNQQQKNQFSISTSRRWTAQYFFHNHISSLSVSKNCIFAKIIKLLIVKALESQSWFLAKQSRAHFGRSMRWSWHVNFLHTNAAHMLELGHYQPNSHPKRLRIGMRY